MSKPSGLRMVKPKSKKRHSGSEYSMDILK
jgi:hypothetical protein